MNCGVLAVSWPHMKLYVLQAKVMCSVTDAMHAPHGNQLETHVIDG